MRRSDPCPPSPSPLPGDPMPLLSHPEPHRGQPHGETFQIDPSSPSGTAVWGLSPRSSSPLTRFENVDFLAGRSQCLLWAPSGSLESTPHCTVEEVAQRGQAVPEVTQQSGRSGEQRSQAVMPWHMSESVVVVRPSACGSEGSAPPITPALGGLRLLCALNIVPRARLSLCLPTCLPLMFIPVVFIGPVFRLLPCGKPFRGQGSKIKR